MSKKIAALLFSMILFVTVAVSAQEQGTGTKDSDWQAIDLGYENNNTYYFDKTSLRYDVDKHGVVNKNIISYREKHINNDPLSADKGSYSVTECKINLKNDTLLLGEETFYKSNGEKRWSEKPTYLIWYTIKPGTIGGSRFSAVAQYVEQNPALIKTE